MKLTVNQLRQIIKEETMRVLGEAAVDPSEIEGMNEYGVLGVVAEIGERVMGTGNQAAGLMYGYRGVGGSPVAADKLAAVVSKLDEECQALQVCVAALKRKAADMRARKNISAAKAGKSEPGEM